MGNLFNCNATCGKSSDLDALNSYFQHLKIRARNPTSFIKSLETGFESYRLRKFGIDEVYKRIIDEYFSDEEEIFKIQSKHFFKHHFQSHTHLLKEVLLGLIFICKSNDFLDVVIKCFIAIDNIQMKREDKNISNEINTIDDDIFDRKIISQSNETNKYIISKKSLRMILSSYLNLITTSCCEFIFKKDYDCNELRNNLEKSQDRYIDEMLIKWSTADVCLDEFLMLNYGCLIHDEIIRNKLIDMSLENNFNKVKDKNETGYGETPS